MIEEGSGLRSFPGGILASLAFHGSNSRERNGRTFRRMDCGHHRVLGGILHDSLGLFRIYSRTLAPYIDLRHRVRYHRDISKRFQSNTTRSRERRWLLAGSYGRLADAVSCRGPMKNR